MTVMDEEQTRPTLRAGGLRHARMKSQIAVLMSRRGDVWATELEDISATGALITRPTNWKGEPGDLWVLDMLFQENLNIHLEARVEIGRASCRERVCTRGGAAACRTNCRADDRSS